MKISRNYIFSVGTLVGSVVGVGMFALPYVATKAGILTLLAFFIIIGAIQHWLHKLHAEVILSTKGQHRGPGFAEKYLGRSSKRLVFMLMMLSSYGSLLAYTIIGGDFLHQLLNPYWGGSVFLYTTILLLLRSLIIFFGLKWITGTEVILTGGLIGSVLIISSIIAGNGAVENFTLFNPVHAILPYGPVFFAVSGIIAVNDICLLMKKEKENIKSALFWGIFIAISIMAIFTFLVTSISGNSTTPDALSGLQPYVSGTIYSILLIIGLIAVTTSFLARAEALEEMYMWDLKLPPTMAWLLVATVPYILYLIGAQDLTTVIALTGAVSGGLLGSLSLAIALHAKKKSELHSPLQSKLTPGLAHALTFLFVFGLLYQLWEIFR